MTRSPTLAPMSRFARVVVAAMPWMLSCGGAAPPPKSTSGVSGASAPESSTAAASSDATPIVAAAADDSTVAPKVRLMPRAVRGDYPSSTVGDHECWQKLGLVDEAEKDFAAIAEACGKPTGMLPYIARVKGELGPADKVDKLEIDLAGGLCYRFFAVGTASIGDVDIRIEAADGAIVAIDQTTHPVAIIESDKPLCIKDDVHYRFVLEVDGPGKGRYVFGVYARPK